MTCTEGLFRQTFYFYDIYTNVKWWAVDNIGPTPTTGDGQNGWHWEGRHVIPYVEGFLMGYTVVSEGIDPVNIYMSGYDLGPA